MEIMPVLFTNVGTISFNLVLEQDTTKMFAISQTTFQAVNPFEPCSYFRLFGLSLCSKSSTFTQFYVRRIYRKFIEFYSNSVLMQ